MANNPTRFPNGIALGYFNQFQAYGRDVAGLGGTAFLAGQQVSGTTAGLIAQGATSLDVSLGSLFYSNNTGLTTISNIYNIGMGRSASNLASGQVDTTAPIQEGKLLYLFFIDNSTTLANAGNIVLNGTANFISVGNSIIQLIGSNGKWYEVSRSSNAQTTVTTFGTNAQSSLAVTGVSLGLLNNTGSTTNSISALSGGVIGQTIRFALVGSNPVRFITGGNIFMPGTNVLVVNASGAYEFVNITGTTWRLLSQGTGVLG